MIKHFNLDIMDKNSNKINIDNYLSLKFKNQDKNYIERQTKRIKYNYELNMKYFESLDYAEFSKYIDEFMKKIKFYNLIKWRRYYEY